MSTENEIVQDNESEDFRKNLRDKYLNRYYRYAVRCSEMERIFGMRPYEYRNRIPLAIVADKTKDYTVEELHAFRKRLRIAESFLSQDEFHHGGYVNIDLEDARDWMIKTWGRVKTVIDIPFKKLRKLSEKINKK